MHPLEKETLKFLQQEKIVQSGDSIVVAVSAGPDSMALLHVLAALAAVLHNTLTAVYVNHGLRPEEASQEETLVKKTAVALGIEYRIGTVNVKDTAASRKLSIEHAARLLRYEFLENVARQVQAEKIAVAHTADDQVEEILMRLVRGTTRQGLAGMKTIRDNRIIRPFLKFPKDRLIDYLERYGIPYLHDSSNLEDIYLRNRIRSELLPYLAENYNPNMHQNLLRIANVLQDEEEFLEKLTDAAWEKIVEIAPLAAAASGKPQPPATHHEGLALKLSLFATEPRAIQRRILEKCCWQMDCQPSASQIEQLLALAMQNNEWNSLHLAEGLRVNVSKEKMIFSYPQGRGPVRGEISASGKYDEYEITLPGPGSYEIAGLQKRLVLETVERTDVADDIPLSTGDCLDSNLFSFPLILRCPKPGDRFVPLGAPGSKKVSDFLSEQKIERLQRRLVPILLASDVILALPGLRINHRYRITDKTTQVLQISLVDM